MRRIVPGPGRLIRRFRADRTGAVTVEFVIIFPLLLMLLLLIVFVSLLISTASDVQQLAHELSRQSLGRLTRSDPPADVCLAMAGDAALMNGLLQQTLLLRAEQLTVAPCPGMPDPDGFVTVTVTYNFAGSLVQALGENFGLDIGIITRTSTLKL